ncbi:MAG: HEAT repeat domain-containing protein [Candidatus Thorarchaeota archaeon]
MGTNDASETDLPLLFRRRKFKVLETILKTLLKDEGWPAIADLIKALPFSSEKRPWVRASSARGERRHISQYTGPVDTTFRKCHRRDCLLWILGIEALRGLDVDILDAFSDIDARNIRALRRDAAIRAKNLFQEQIERGNTFFFSFEEISTSPFAIMLPELVEVRKQEVVELRENAFLREIAATYYGFEIMARGSVVQSRAGMPPEVLQTVNQLCNQMGGKLDAEGQRIPGRVLFQNCSNEASQLLQNILIMSGGGIHRRITAMEDLGCNGDARVVPYLIAKLSSLKGVKVEKRALPRKRLSDPSLVYVYEVDTALWSLGTIGDSSAYEAVLTRAKEGWEQAIWALAGIPHPKSMNALKSLVGSIDKSIMETAVDAICSTNDPELVELLGSAFESAKYKAEAYLQISRHPFLSKDEKGEERIALYFERVADDIIQGGLSKALDVLKNPDIILHESIQNAVIEAHISDAYETKSTIHLSRLLRRKIEWTPAMLVKIRKAIETIKRLQK